MPLEQKQILLKFRSVYPDLTLNQISLLTKIQVTRVFRIFRGSEMKLLEFFTFKDLVEKKLETSPLSKLTSYAEKYLTFRDQKEFLSLLTQRVELRKLELN